MLQVGFPVVSLLDKKVLTAHEGGRSIFLYTALLLGEGGLCEVISLLKGSPSCTLMKQVGLYRNGTSRLDDPPSNPDESGPVQ